jgi:hypothetical protein
MVAHTHRLPLPDLDFWRNSKIYPDGEQQPLHQKQTVSPTFYRALPPHGLSTHHHSGYILVVHDWHCLYTVTGSATTI